MLSVFGLKAEGGAHGLDRDEVLRALSILIDPGTTFELRGITPGVGASSRVCQGQDLPAAVEAAWELSEHNGVYWCMGPLPHGHERAARDRDILSRRWLLVDVDTKRPEHDSSATESEKAKSAETVGRILDYLTDLGWPCPLMVDSGNGWHLLYRVDLPADKLSQQLVKSVLQELARRFDNEYANVDKSVHNAARVSKLPGTWVRKGPDTKERPHRCSKIIFEPETMSIVSVDQLAALVTPQNKPEAKSPFATQAPADKGLEAYCRAAIDKECTKLALTGEGSRNVALNTAAFVLGTLGRWPEMIGLDPRKSLHAAARQCGLEDWEIDLTIRSGWDAGYDRPRDRPEEQKAKASTQSNSTPTGSPIIWGSAIKPKKVEWLWPGRIPVGKQTTFAGQTGMGKTFTVCDIAARITVAGEIPFSGGAKFQEGTVLMISAEDDADDTIMPRFIELGGDPSKIAFLSPESEEHFSLAALDLLNKSLDAMGPHVRMVAIDPPTSYLGRTDDHKNAELRGLLGPLKRWAAQRQIALIFVTHVNKAGGQKVDAMARVIGSVAWVAAVRAAHMFCADPETNDRNLFVPLKVNNAKKSKTLSYIIEPTKDDLAILKWMEEVDTTADEAMGNVKRKSRGMCAVEWLEERFRERYEWSSDELKSLAAEAGVSKNALWSPEVNALPIEKKKRIDATGDTKHFWRSTSPDWPPKKSDGKVGNVGKGESNVF